MGGGLESRCVGRVYGADGAARHHPHVWLGDDNSKLQGTVADHQLNNINFISQKRAVCLKRTICLLGT